MNAKARIMLIVSFILLICLGGLLLATSLTWYPFMWFLLVPGIAGFAAWVVIEKNVIWDFLNTRSSKNGLSMGVLLIGVLLILIAVNFLSARHTKTFDFSLTKQFTLSEQSRKIIDNLSEKLEIFYFYQEGLSDVEKDKKSFSRLVQIFSDYSPRISLRFVEMNSRPALVKEFGATRPTGEAFIAYKDKKNRVEGATEQDFVNAVIKTTRTSRKEIYFVTGHGERAVDQEKSPLSISNFAKLIENNAFKVEALNLYTAGKIPDTADVIIIAGPTEKFQKSEINLLQGFLQRGGKLLIFFENKFDAGLADFNESLGFELQNYFVANVFNLQGNSVVDLNQPTVAVQFASAHQTTKMMTQNNGVIFLQPSSFILKQNQKTIRDEILVMTPEAAVALPELSSSEHVGKPQAFPVVVEASGTYGNSSKQFKVLAFSDVDVISNSLLFQRSNKDLALNSVSYLAGEDDLVSISPKNPQISTLLMKDPEFGQFFKVMLVGFFIPIPFVFLAISGFLWMRRRNA